MFKRKLSYFLTPVLIVSAAFVVYEQYQDAATEFVVPIERYSERPKLLTFGLYVTPDPEQNPIDPPERFIGYHTALDLEIFEEEQEKEVPIYAACDGQVIFAQSTEGYGGIIIQSCQLKNQPVTVLYGHIDPDSFQTHVDNFVKRGDKIALLAQANSAGSGFNRKHLHFSIHKGAEIKTLGYVQTKEELTDYIDPITVLSN